MKTYIELEEIGIVGTYVFSNLLRIITKGGHVWQYIPSEKRFKYHDLL